MRNVRQQTRKRELVPEHTGSREEWRVMDRRVAGSHNIVPVMFASVRRNCTRYDGTGCSQGCPHCVGTPDEGGVEDYQPPRRGDAVGQGCRALSVRRLQP